MPADDTVGERASRLSSRRKMLKLAATGSTIGLTGLAGCTGGGSNGGGNGNGDDTPTAGNGGSDDTTVFFLIPAQDVTRWSNRDFPKFKETVEQMRPDWTVESRDAGGSQSTQLSQVEDAITQGADAFVMIAAVPNEAGGTLQKAADADIPVILHERGATGGPATARAAYDAYSSGVSEGEAAIDVIDRLLQDRDTVSIIRIYGQQGGLWAEEIRKGQNEVLQPYIDDGSVEVLNTQYTGWGQEEARRFVEDSVTRFGDELDMILASNDGTSNGAVQALTAQGYQPGEIPIAGGQDATLAGVQLILEGWLHATYYKSIPKLSQVSAELTIAAVENNELPQNRINDTYDNGHTEMPMAALTGQNVTQDNIDVLVENNVYTWEEMCQGVEGSDICNQNT